MLKSKDRNLFYLIIMAMIVLECFFYTPKSIAEEECNKKEPACIVSIVFESGIKLRYDGLEEYTCKDKLYLIDRGKAGAKYQIERKKKSGIDFYQQAKFDFSNLNYKETIDKNQAIVFITGFFIGKLDGKGFEYKGKVDEVHNVVKEDGNWKWCGYKKTN
jgi:hypothetical protein